MRDNNLERKRLITLTSDIIAAHVINNDVDAGELPLLITNVYGALAVLGQSQTEAEERPEPAVSIRASVKPDYVVCLEDGKKMKMLKRHLRTDHDMTPQEYRMRWNLPVSHPLVAPGYSEKRRELAKKSGLGRKPAARVKRRKKLAASFKS